MRSHSESWWARSKKAQAEAVSVGHYGGRFFAVYFRGQLLCVTVYRKGAEAVRDVILELMREEGGAGSSHPG